MDVTTTNRKVQAPQAQDQEKHPVSVSSPSRSLSQSSHSSHSSPAKSQSYRSGPNSIPFPWKLHQILDDAATQKFDSIISWVPSHNGFKVHKPKEFDSTIMPKYFHQTKYKSFQRQLNMWGFERVGNGEQKGSYLHPYFIRGKPNLCREMQRTKIKGIHSKKLRKSITNNTGSDHSGTGMNSMSSMSSIGMMNSMNMIGRHSLSNMAMGCMNNMNATRTFSSTGGSGLGLGLASTQAVAASWQAAAHKVAELERQREEIEKKLNAVVRQHNQMNDSGMNNNMMTQRITEAMDSSCVSNSSSNSSSNSNSNSNSQQQQQDITNQVQGQLQGQLQGLQGLQQVGLQGIINASSVPLEEGDSLFFEGRNFFFVEEGTPKETGSDGADGAEKMKPQEQRGQGQSQPQGQQQQQRRPSRPSRRFSLELKGPDSDEYVLKELEEAIGIDLGTGIFNTDTTPATSNNDSHTTTTNATCTSTNNTITAATASQYLDIGTSYGNVSTSAAKRVSSYYSQDQDQEDFLPIPISFPLSSPTSSSSNSNHNEPTSINGLFLGLDRPGRRFSLSSTPVYNPFETKTNISNSNLSSFTPQTKSKSFMTSCSRNDFNNNNNNSNKKSNNILRKFSTRVSF